MVNLDEEDSVGDLEFADYQLAHVNNRLNTIKKNVYNTDSVSDIYDISPKDIDKSPMMPVPHATITDCQVVIELSAKAIFKSFGINPVEKHEINFDNDRVSGLLSRVPKEDNLHRRVTRVVFVTQFWERFYTLSKYGVPEENISSFEIMDVSDGLRALQDADFCRNVASDVHSYVLEEKELNNSDLDTDVLKHLFSTE